VIQEETATVVVVDDRVTNRNILTRLAQSVAEGVRVHAFARARDALTFFDGHPPPDLVITDYNMPEMDGATFITLLRARPGFEEVPIIVVTVYEDREYRYRALEAGATDFLLSPVDHVEFRVRARNLLLLRRREKRLLARMRELEEALGARSDRALATLDWQACLEALPVPLRVVDAQGRFVYVNRAYAEMCGSRPERIVGQTVAQVHGEAYAVREAVLDEKVLEGGRASSSLRRETLETAEGARTLLTVRAPLDAAGGARQVVTLGVDVTALEHGRGAVRAHDRLTGIPGPELLREHLAHELARARRRGYLVAVHLLDLDRFKGINEAFEDAFGDALLQAVAERLAARLGEHEFLARLRSDEFVVVQTRISRPDEAAELCHRLEAAFAEPFRLSGREIHTSASIGVTLYPGDGRTVDALLKNAEVAMYRAKHAGRDTYRFFSQEMNLEARRAVALERELRQALAADQFLVHYQPQADLDTGEVVGVEALVRWNHPQRGIVGPGEFIAMAEDIGLIAPLTAWVLETACRQQVRWLEMGFGGRLSVNFSAVQFRDRGIERLVHQTLARTGLPPQALEIEIVEHAVIEHSRSALQALEALARLGVRIALDDFGTGYSSLAYLRRLPVHRLKIDRSFVCDLAEARGDRKIVEAIVGLARSLGLELVAEGVETEAQRDILAEMGCRCIQGHLVAPPLPAEEFEARFVRRPVRALACD